MMLETEIATGKETVTFSAMNQLLWRLGYGKTGLSPHPLVF